MQANATGQKDKNEKMKNWAIGGLVVVIVAMAIGWILSVQGTRDMSVTSAEEEYLDVFSSLVESFVEDQPIIEGVDTANRLVDYGVTEAGNFYIDMEYALIDESTGWTSDYHGVRIVFKWDEQTDNYVQEYIYDGDDDTEIEEQLNI